MAEEPVPDHNKSADTQGFFSGVVTGKSDKYKPRRKWQPLMAFTKAQEAVRSVYEKFNGKFDEHIATSIPVFRDVQIKVVSAVNDLFGKKGGVVYDIGGSEGGFGKTITELSGGRVKSINLDASSDMEKVHNATPVEGATFVKEAFGEGFEWDGETFKKHIPEEKADVVHESMTFQFIDEKRNDKLTEVVDNYLKPDGLFITEEKVHPKEDAQWRANEAKKDADFKSKYYDKDQIDTKREEALTGMVTNQTTYDRYKNELLKKFDHVAEYWDSGNFKGFVASNDKAKVGAFLEKVGNTDTEFSEKNVNPAEIGPETSANYANLTEDGKGNYVFYHYSGSERDVIDPKKYGTNPSRPTSGEEASAMGKVGGMSQFYTDIKDTESKLGSYGHEVRVPVDKVYDVNKDPLNFYDEAKKQFNAKYPDMAFGPNDQVAWITKVAADKGYTMTIAEWNGKTRAQSVVPQTPTDVQKMLGRVVVKDYDERFTSNRDLGYKMGEGKSIEPKEIGFQAQKLFTHKGEVPKFKNLTELTKWLGSWGKKNKVFASEEVKANDKTFVNKLAEHTLEELRAWEGLTKYKYLGFYDYDIPSVLNPGLQKFAQKRYGRELTNAEISLYHIVSGFASPSADPVFDSSVGLGVFDKYMRTGELSSLSDKAATIWAVNEKGRGVDTGEPKLDAEGKPVMSQVARAYATHALGKLNTVISKFDGNLDKAVEWLTSKHSYEELSTMVDAPLKGAKALSEHENLTKEDGAFGMFALTGSGAKLGSYLLNRVGEFSTITKDLWYARTMARLTGEPLQDETGKVLILPWGLAKEGIRKRKLADKAWGIVAEKLGITPAEVQQRMWDFEKRLYEQLGTDAKSGRTGYASEGFAKKAKELEPTLDLTDTMSPAQIAKEVENINTEPTEAQKEAGNYRMGHVGIKGMDISIETPRGATRSGVDAEGKPWSTDMQDHYGYFKGTTGKDGDHIDTFIGQHPESNWAFVVDQIDPKTGVFDESKVMLGYENVAEARAAYDRNYSADWTGFKDITAVPVSQLKTWLYDGAKQGKPFADYVEHNELYKHSAAEAKLVEGIVGALDTGKNRDFPTRIMDNEAVADHMKGKISPEFEQSIRDEDWAGLHVDKETFIHPDTSAEEAVATWVHEQSHVQLTKDYPKVADRVKFCEDLFDKVGEEEIKRVVPESYWQDGKYTMAKEYLAHLAEDIPAGGELFDKAPEDVKKLIFDTVNSFTTLKDIQDAKEIIANQRSGNGEGNAHAGLGDRGRLAENEGNSGKGADDLNAGLRQAPGGEEEESLKAKQLKIVTEANPMTDDYHTGIRSEKDILTDGEAFAEGIKSGDGAAPDFKSSDMEKALSTGKVTVYSSNPIENGVFVSPSRMEAKNYAGDGRVYSKEVNTSDVAWIDDIQGQYAKVDTSKDPTPKEGKIKVDGVDRHVQNSEGQVIHPTIGGVENFWRWFGESKVVDAEGRPEVLYHGTRAEKFDKFKEGRIIFLTDSKEVAGEYAGEGNTNPEQVGTKYELYTSLKNPLVVDAKGSTWDNVIVDGKRMDTVDVARKAFSEGYDGVVLNNINEVGHEGNNYMAFDPKQVKSTTDNTGDFDPNKPEINFRKREPKETLFDYFRAEALDKAKWFPGVTEVAEPIGEFSTALKNTMVPYAQKEGGKLAAKSMTANLGDMQRGIDVAEKQLRGAEKKFNKMTNEENLDFIDRMESNLPQPTPELQGYADALRGQIDGARDRVRALGTGKLETFIENYFPHYWEDPKKADALLTSVGRRPLEGPKTFLKKRTIEYTREGVDKGLIPVSWNPVKLALLKIREMERYTMAHATINELKEAGYIKYVRMGQDKPEGFVPIDDKVGTVMKMNPDTHMLELMGHYYAEPNSARILNNFLSKGLRGNAAFDIYRGLGNTITQLQLGLSAFHLGFTSMDAAISTQAIGWEYLYHGKVGAAMKQFTKVPFAPVANFLEGNKLMKAWYGNPTTPQMSIIADMMAKAGGRAKMDDFYQEKWMDKIRENVRNRRYVKAAWQVPMQLIELTSKPILSYIVPRQKLGVFADMAKYEMKLHPDMTPEELRGRLQKAWASVDNRMGQLVYDNLFWNHVTKDIAMASVRSVGWNLGTFREVGGAPKEALDIFTSGVKGQTAEQTHKLAYMISLVTTTMLSSAIFQYLRTGKGPDEPRDYFFPKDGGTDKNGDATRVSMPTYVKDLYHYSSDFPSGAMNTLKNKLSPVNGIVAQMMTNKDYYGTKVYDEDDTAVEKTKEVFNYLGEQLIPFGIRNVKKSTSDRLADKILPFIGIVPAPFDLNMSDAEKKMSEIMREKLPIGGRTKEQADKSQIKSDIRNQFIKSGSEAVLDEAVKANKITDTEADKIWEDAQLTPIERSAKRLNPTELFGVYKIATPEEKKLISPILMDKIFNAEDKEPDEVTMEKMNRMINTLEEDNKK
jgi:sulfur relay (sulfurtransferase) DsrC/TusE family protein